MGTSVKDLNRPEIRGSMMEIAEIKSVFRRVCRVRRDVVKWRESFCSLVGGCPHETE